MEHADLWSRGSSLVCCDLSSPLELEGEGLDSYASEAEEPEVGAAELPLRDVMVAELGDGTGAVRENGVDES